MEGSDGLRCRVLLRSLKPLVSIFLMTRLEMETELMYVGVIQLQPVSAGIGTQ